MKTATEAATPKHPVAAAAPARVHAPPATAGTSVASAVTAPPLVCLGQVIAPHGIRGEVRVRSYAGAPEQIGAYGPLLDDAGRTFTVEEAREHAGGVIARLAGVADRNAAAALRGTHLYVHRDRLPEPAKGEYYHTDLIGLRLEGPDGERMGTVTAVHNYGAGDLLCVRQTDGVEALVPFADSYVTEVDFEARRILADPSSALLDPTGGD